MNVLCARLALIMLVIANLTTIISISTPNWLEFEVGKMGLWVNCTVQECDSIFDITEHGNKIEDYLIATQSLMSIGLLAIFVALIIASSEMCCACTGCNSDFFVSCFLSVGDLCLGIAVTVFGITSSRKFVAERFGWSFWMAVAANGLTILTTLIYQFSPTKPHQRENTPSSN